MKLISLFSSIGFLGILSSCLLINSEWSSSEKSCDGSEKCCLKANCDSENRFSESNDGLTNQPSETRIATSSIMKSRVKSDSGSKASEKELEAITESLNHYIHGSTGGQPKRLKKVFHPKLNLYSVRKGKLSTWSGVDYIKSTKKGKPTGETGKILAIDFETNIAVAKVLIAPPKGRKFIDYFMLLKIEGNWTIVHKMYTGKNEHAGKTGEWKSEASKNIKSENTRSFRSPSILVP